MMAIPDNKINNQLTFGYFLLTLFILYSLFFQVDFWSGLFLGGGAAFVCSVVFALPSLKEMREDRLKRWREKGKNASEEEEGERDD